MVAVLPRVMGKTGYEEPDQKTAHTEDSDGVWALLTDEQNEKVLRNLEFIKSRNITNYWLVKTLQ